MDQVHLRTDTHERLAKLQMKSNIKYIIIMHEYAWRQEDCGLKQQVAVKRK